MSALADVSVDRLGPREPPHAPSAAGMKVVFPQQRCPAADGDGRHRGGQKGAEASDRLSFCSEDSHALKIKGGSLLCGKHRAMFVKAVEHPEGQWVSPQGRGPASSMVSPSAEGWPDCPARGCTHGRQSGGGWRGGACAGSGLCVLGVMHQGRVRGRGRGVGLGGVPGAEPAQGGGHSRE